MGTNRHTAKKHRLTGTTFMSPHTNDSYVVQSVSDGVATMVRNEFVTVERLEKEWRRDKEMDFIERLS